MIHSGTSEIGTTSLQGTKLLPPKCPLFGVSTVATAYNGITIYSKIGVCVCVCLCLCMCVYYDKAVCSSLQTIQECRSSRNQEMTSFEIVNSKYKAETVLVYVDRMCIYDALRVKALPSSLWPFVCYRGAAS